MVERGEGAMTGPDDGFGNGWMSEWMNTMPTKAFTYKW